MERLTIWLTETRKRWPGAQLITMGEFGLLWRDHFKNNGTLDYQFVQRGSGVRGSVEELEVRWFISLTLEAQRITRRIHGRLSQRM